MSQIENADRKQVRGHQSLYGNGTRFLPGSGTNAVMIAFQDFGSFMDEGGERGDVILPFVESRIHETLSGGIDNVPPGLSSRRNLFSSAVAIWSGPEPVRMSVSSSSAIKS